MQQLKSVQQAGSKSASHADTRPKVWEAVVFKPVPLQEGEEGLAEEDATPLEDSPVPDPLGLSELDLRATQALNASGRLNFQTAGLSRVNNTARRMIRNSMGGGVAVVDDFDDDDDDADADAQAGAKEATSVLPHEKNFSPSLFLTLVHGSISFAQLQDGSARLRARLHQQSSQREDLVRTHFGLFVHCAEGLEWLKAYRKGSK